MRCWSGVRGASAYSSGLRQVGPLNYCNNVRGQRCVTAATCCDLLQELGRNGGLAQAELKPRNAGRHGDSSPSFFASAAARAGPDHISVSFTPLSKRLVCSSWEALRVSLSS